VHHSTKVCLVYGTTRGKRVKELAPLFALAVVERRCCATMKSLRITAAVYTACASYCCWAPSSNGRRQVIKQVYIYVPPMLTGTYAAPSCREEGKCHVIYSRCACSTGGSQAPMHVLDLQPPSQAVHIPFASIPSSRPDALPSRRCCTCLCSTG